MTAPAYRPPQAWPSASYEHCQVCGLRAATHPRCVDCDILTGPGHEALVDGVRCFTCRRAHNMMLAAEAALEARIAAERGRRLVG